MVTCRKCGLEIRFVREGGKLFPANLDGSDHFDICRETSFKIVQRDGVFFSKPDREGYLYRGLELLTIIHGRDIVGENYVPAKCACIPWEGCEICCPAELTEADVAGLQHLRTLYAS